MKVLVTGACGFIGMNLCEHLLKNGHEIVGIDNFYTSKKEHLNTIASSPRFVLIEHDIIHPLPLHDDNIPDIIFHLACPASPNHYLKDPIFTTRTCALGTMNMLDMATKYDIPILHASTSEVYGDPKEHPQEEHHWGNVNPIGVRSCYDEGKRVAESLCFDYKRMHNTKIKVIRIFNTYGPFMVHDDGRVISNFITQALVGTPLTVYGQGTQTRSFCYIDDLVNAICTFAFLDDPDNTITGPINLGNPHEITIKTLAEYIAKFIPDITITYKELPSDDPQQRNPNISYATRILQWVPSVSLEEGLQHTIRWFKTHTNNIKEAV